MIKNIEFNKQDLLNDIDVLYDETNRMFVAVSFFTDFKGYGVTQKDSIGSLVNKVAQFPKNSGYIYKSV